MNKTKMLLAMGFGAAIIIATPTLRAEMKDMKGMESAEKSETKMEINIPATGEGIWQEIHKRHGELEEVVKSKKLDDVHHHAFAIRDLAKALVAKTPANKKTVVKATVKKISMLAAELDKSGDAGDQAATEVNMKKFDGTLDNLEAQFKKK